MSLQARHLFYTPHSACVPGALEGRKAYPAPTFSSRAARYSRLPHLGSGTSNPRLSKFTAGGAEREQPPVSTALTALPVVNIFGD
jgi:hypothetical protein